MKQKVLSLFLILAIIIAGFVGLTPTADAATAAELQSNIASAYALDAANAWRIIALQAQDDSNYQVSAQAQEAFVAAAIDDLSAATAYTATSKALKIITLTSLGYDASQVVDNGVVYNAYNKLSDQLTADTAYGGWTEIYAYSLMAFLQGSPSQQVNYTTQINSCIAALNSGGDGDWAAYGFSPDSAGIALTALCLARDQGFTVDAAVITGLINDLKSNLQTNGSFADSYSATQNAESTALALLGLDAAGEDVTTLTASGGTTALFDGLLSFAAPTNDGFVHVSGGSLNEMATQQGMLALIAAQKSGATNVFDFCGGGSSITEAASHYAYCPVVFTTTPTSATVAVNNGAAVADVGLAGRYDLPAGTYSYTVTADGYTDETNTLVISDSDAASHLTKTLNITLSRTAVNTDIHVRVYVKTHDGASCNNSYTYKYNATAYSNIVDQSVTLTEGSSVSDALAQALSQAGLSYNQNSSGYIQEIDGLAALDHGADSGWIYLVNGSAATIGCQDYILYNRATVTWIYTDDYRQEYGSESWSDPEPVVASKSTFAVDAQGSVGIPLSDLVALSKADKDIVVTSKLANIAFTPQGLSDLLKQVTSNNMLSVSVKSAVGTDGFSVIADDKAVTSFSIRLTAGQQKITDGFGTLSITINVGAAYAGQSMDIIHLKEDGSSEVISAQADAEGNLQFNVSSLSCFVVFAAEDTPVTYLFGDLNAKAWYLDDVQYVCGYKIMNGATASTFEPDASLSRAMLVTMLWRQEGKPQSSFDPGFSDTDSSAYYQPAVAWAAQKEIIGGYSDGLFGPDDPITRQQMVAVFYRYADYKGYAAKQTADLSAYRDKSQIEPYAFTAFGWAVKQNIINGSTIDTLSPQAPTSRAEAAAIFHRFAALTAQPAAVDTIDAAYNKTAGYIINNYPAAYGSEWALVGLYQGGYTLPSNWSKDYYQSVCSSLSACDGKLSDKKYSEYSRLIYALTTAGYDAANVASYDLTAPLNDYDATVYQGLNGPIWALIALDSGNYQNARRQDYLQYILDHELPDGGWALNGDSADTDVTAMALRALAPYQKDSAAAIERGLDKLSALQEQGGGFASYGIANCESCAQVIMALDALGIKADDNRFIKNNNMLTTALLAYQLSDGSFTHTLGGKTNVLATQQAFCALSAIK